MLQLKNFIDGEYVDPVEGKHFEKKNPSTGKGKRTSIIALRSVAGVGLSFCCEVCYLQ